MFKKLKESREAAREVRAHAEVVQRVGDLSLAATRAHEAYEAAQLSTSESRVQGVQLKKGEVAYLVLSGAGLVEPRRGPTQWVGGSQGVSFRIAKGMRYHVGGTRGHVVQGEERPTVIDTGLGVITNQRITFIGGKRSAEWAFAKLLGFSLELDSMAIFNVSNRQKASGLAYPPSTDLVVDAVVSAAVAAFQSADDLAQVVQGYRTLYEASYAKWSAANSEFPGIPAAKPLTK